MIWVGQCGQLVLMRGRAGKGWVDELLGFVQLGLGRVVVGLLEGILDGLVGLSVRNRVIVTLKRLKGPKGFGVGPFFLPTSIGHVIGPRKGKLSLKGIGLGCLNSKRARLKPSHWVKSLAVDLVSSLQQASEDCLGAFCAGAGFG